MSRLHVLLVYVESLRWIICFGFFFFQAEDGIRDLVRSRGLGDVYKRKALLVERPVEGVDQFAGFGGVALQPDGKPIFVPQFLSLIHI